MSNNPWRSSIGNTHLFDTFDQYNAMLIHDGRDLTFLQYIDLAGSIPATATGNKKSHEYAYHDNLWMKDWIIYLIGVSSRDDHGFNIPISDLSCLGVDILRYSSKLPKWFRALFHKHDDYLSKELRMLKAFKLYHTIDYRENRHCANGEVVTVGHNITLSALYRIIKILYGSEMLEMMLGRMGQVTHFYDDYKTTFYMNKISELKQRVAEFSTEVETLRIEAAETIRTPPSDSYSLASTMSYSPANAIGSPEDINSLHDEDHSMFGDQCFSNNCEIGRGSYDGSRDPCSSVTSSDQLFNEEISDIHFTIESGIRHDTGVVTLNQKLASINAKIDDLVESMDDSEYPDSASVLAESEDSLERLSVNSRTFTIYPGQIDSLIRDSDAPHYRSGSVDSLDLANTHTPDTPRLVNHFNRFTCIGNEYMSYHC